MTLPQLNNKKGEIESVMKFNNKLDDYELMKLKETNHDEINMIKTEVKLIAPVA